MRPPCEIKTNYGWRLGCLGALGALFGMPLLIGGLMAFAEGRTDRGVEGVLWGLGTFMFLAALPSAIMLLAKRGSVRRFDERGVTLHNGRLLPWSDFTEVRTVYVKRNAQRGIVNNYTLVFKNRKAPVYFKAAKNRAELLEVIDSLKSGRNPWA